MAYFKRRYSKRPARRYRRYRRSVASKALYLARKANRTELKYFPVSVTTPVTFAANKYIQPLSFVPQGTAMTERIGLSMTSTSINIHMLMKLDDLGELPHTVRVVLFLWRSELYAPGSENDSDYLQQANVISYKNESQRFQSKDIV